ncbi:DUF3142 domain-containing protein [Armatimonas sp.]|uniref:DUF3142 domain-containing protein n=1 Tax=Armatimonas sp. TaxID=1872638 RepID=UPI00286B348B|nr:DUF3142 domain-containing protein [Armatimonas sp.]
MKPHSKFILLGLVLAGIFWGVWGWQRAKTPLPPLTKSLWYWHRPFLLKDEEVAQLRTAGVSEIFVHAGLLYRRDEDGTLGVTLGQSWKSRADGLKVHVVFNASADVLSRLEKLPEETLAETMASAARTQKQAAQKVGVEVIGLQCDLDFPTRLLLRYATLIKLLRSKLPGWQLSATLLSTWYTSHNLDAVLDALDFSVPQFYESQTPRGYADFTPIFSPRVLERGLATAGRRGKPFRAGLPAYGHALVFDGPGRLRGMYRDGGADTLASDPAFHCLRAETDSVTGNRRLEFTAAQAGAVDFRILFDLPTALSVQKALALTMANRPRNCTGFVLFRLPEPGETSTLPLPTLTALLKNQTPILRPRIRIRTKPAAAWSAIEGGGEAGTLVFVDLINDGDAGSALGPETVTLDLELTRPGVVDVAPGGFAKATLFAESPERAVSPLRATGVRWSAANLPPKTTLTVGPLRLKGSEIGTLNVHWRVLALDGKTAQVGEGK